MGDRLTEAQVGTVCAVFSLLATLTLVVVTDTSVNVTLVAMAWMFIMSVCIVVNAAAWHDELQAKREGDGNA